MPRYKKPWKRFCAAQPRERMAVEADGIDHEGYQGPCLFRVPAPVGAPKTGGPTRRLRKCQCRGRRQQGRRSRRPRGMSGSACREMQSEDACEHGESQQGVAYHYHGDVQAQPGREARTGMRFVICGLLWPRCDTSRAKASQKKAEGKQNAEAMVEDT